MSLEYLRLVRIHPDSNDSRVADGARNNIRQTACAKKSLYQTTGRQRAHCAIGERTDNPEPKSSRLKQA